MQLIPQHLLSTRSGSSNTTNSCKQTYQRIISEVLPDKIGRFSDIYCQYREALIREKFKQEEELYRLKELVTNLRTEQYETRLLVLELKLYLVLHSSSERQLEFLTQTFVKKSTRTFRHLRRYRRQWKRSDPDNERIIQKLCCNILELKNLYIILLNLLLRASS